MEQTYRTRLRTNALSYINDEFYMLLFVFVKTRFDQEIVSEFS